MKDEAADWSNIQLPETRKPMSDMLQLVMKQIHRFPPITQIAKLISED